MVSAGQVVSQKLASLRWAQTMSQLRHCVPVTVSIYVGRDNAHVREALGRLNDGVLRGSPNISELQNWMIGLLAFHFLTTCHPREQNPKKGAFEGGEASVYGVA